jgi:hypothetical protein
VKKTKEWPGKYIRLVSKSCPYSGPPFFSIRTGIFIEPESPMGQVQNFDRFGASVTASSLLSPPNLKMPRPRALGSAARPPASFHFFLLFGLAASDPERRPCAVAPDPVNERTNERTSERTNERTSERANGTERFPASPSLEQARAEWATLRVVHFGGALGPEKGGGGVGEKRKPRQDPACLPALETGGR